MTFGGTLKTDSPLLQSKSSIKADLLAKRREKTKQRKEARKVTAGTSLHKSTSTVRQSSEVTGKRVSFA